MGKRNNRSRGRNRSQDSGNAKSSSNASSNEGRSRSGRGRKRKRSVPFNPEIHFLPGPVPERDYACPISETPVENVLTAIAEPRSGQPARFEAVLEVVSREEAVEENERIAYLGRGAFGIVSIQRGENGRPELVVRKRIQYEDNHEKYTWRRELSPGISRDYVPTPEPLSQLYTPDELASFPRFDSAGSSYVSRGN